MGIETAELVGLLPREDAIRQGRIGLGGHDVFGYIGYIGEVCAGRRGPGILHLVVD